MKLTALESASQTFLIELLADKLADTLLGEKIPFDMVDFLTGEIIIPCNRKINRTLLSKLARVILKDRFEIDPSPVRNKISNIVNDFVMQYADRSRVALRDAREKLLGRPVGQ